MKRLKIGYLVVIILMAVTSCKNSQQTKVLPAISGKAGEIAVVTGKDNWDGAPGTALRAVLTQDFPFLPQPEPLYNLFQVPQSAFNKVFQVHRNIIFISTGEDYAEAKMLWHEDIWATPQTVIRIEAPDAVSAADLIARKGDEIIDIFDNAERARVIRNAKEFDQADVHKKVADIFGGSPCFPTGYTIKKVTGNFAWISNETSFINQSIIMYKYPYQGSSQMTQPALAAKRNAVTQEEIPCTVPNSYMIINPMIAPGYAFKSFNNLDLIEMRGLWDAHNDYMGGPFVSHTYLSPDQTEVVTVEGFVYAPKYNKRNYLKQVESIIYTFSWK